MCSDKTVSNRTRVSPTFRKGELMKRERLKCRTQERGVKHKEGSEWCQWEVRGDTGRKLHPETRSVRFDNREVAGVARVINVSGVVRVWVSGCWRNLFN